MLKELIARLAQKKAEAENLIKVADASNEGNLTAEQSTQFDEIMAEIDGLNSSIEKRQKLEAMTLEDNKGIGRKTENVHIEVKENIDPSNGFSDIAEFSHAVRIACDKSVQGIDERLTIQSAPSNYHKEGGTSEGYQVPPAFRKGIWDDVWDDKEDDLLTAVESEPTESNSVEMLKDQSTPWGATGIVAKWADEAKQFDASKLSTEAAQLKLHKMYAFVMASDELLTDAPRLANRLTKGAAAAIRWKANDSIAYGTGAGQPLGYMNSAALVSIAKESGQAADTLVVENIVKMFSRLLSHSIGRAFWRMNSDVLPQLLTMTLGGHPIWTPPATGITGAPGGFLLGRPIKFSEHTETIGTKGDVQLVDPKGYYLAKKKQGIKFSSSIHLYFDYDIEAFKWTFRMGGQPFLSAPVSPNKGSNTKSHFVTLDERA